MSNTKVHLGHFTFHDIEGNVIGVGEKIQYDHAVPNVPGGIIRQVVITATGTSSDIETQIDAQTATDLKTHKKDIKDFKIKPSSPSS